MKGRPTGTLDRQPRFRRPTPATTGSPTLQAIFAAMGAKKRPVLETAIELGMSRVGLSYWKSGRSTPRIDDVENLAELLGLEIVVREKP